VLLGSVSSIGGFQDIGVYSAVKAAIRALTRNYVVELSDRGIRVNTLSPGPTATELLEEYPGGPENLPRSRSVGSRAPRRSPPPRCSSALQKAAM